METGATHADITGSGEEFTETVERGGHDTVCRVECLLHTVAVVDIDVNVQHTRVNAQELQNAEDASQSQHRDEMPPLTCR